MCSHGDGVDLIGLVKHTMLTLLLKHSINWIYSICLKHATVSHFEWHLKEKKLHKWKKKKTCRWESMFNIVTVAVQMNEHIEHKMYWFLHWFSGDRNFCAGVHYVTTYTSSIYRADNLHIWLSIMISMMTLDKVSWLSPYCWMASWRELITVAWVPEFWYVFMASFKVCLSSLLLGKRKYKYSKMRMHPVKYCSERIRKKGPSVPHQHHEWLTSVCQTQLMQDTLKAMNLISWKCNCCSKM